MAPPLAAATSNFNQRRVPITVETPIAGAREREQQATSKLVPVHGGKKKRRLLEAAHVIAALHAGAGHEHGVDAGCDDGDAPAQDGVAARAARRAHGVYRCKQCGEPKKGHWCKVLYKPLKAGAAKRSSSSELEASATRSRHGDIHDSNKMTTATL